MALYRKHRPQVFTDIVGQGNVLQILRGAIEIGAIGHAYIFSGPRGTGKTSMARIFAKAINCLAEKDKPCGVCSVCVQIAEGSFLDMIEIDAASNRGIDQIRDLKEKVQFMPNVGKYKVYIIDEAHMLTKDAFNALLKTLEEPPSHAIFILATTETHKIPITILSRCQRLDFTRIDRDEIFSALKLICEKENIIIDDSALDRLITIGEGSFRDTLSYLDQIRSFMGTKDISGRDLEAALGLSPSESVDDFILSIISSDRERVIKGIDTLYRRGVDFEYFLKEVVLTFYDFVVNPAAVGHNQEIQALIQNIGSERLGRILNILTDGISKVRNVLLPNISILVLAFECMADDGLGAQKKSILATSQDASSDTKNVASSTTSVRAEEPTGEKENLKKGGNGSAAKNISANITEGDIWGALVEKVKDDRPSIGLSLVAADHHIANGFFEIFLSNGFIARQLSEPKNVSYIQDMIKNISGVEYTVKISSKEVGKPKKKELIDDVLDVFEGGEIID